MSLQRSPPPKKNSPSATNLQPALSDPTLNSQSLEVGIKDIFVNVGRRTRRRLDEESYEPNSTGCNTLLSEITKLFSDFERKQNRKLDSMNSTMSDILDQNSKIHESITFFSQKYDELLERLDTTERENCLLKQQISSLEYKIEYLERDTRSAMIEINNLPPVLPENKETLTERLISVGTAINLPINTADVKNIYRMKPKKNTSSISSVLVEFQAIAMRDKVLKSTRLYNKQNGNSKLSTATIKLPGPATPIYITESLTSYSKHIYYLARKLQKEGKCDSCWTNYGKIFIRKTASSAPFCVKTEKDILTFLQNAK